ncbi:hypothetical protein NQ314_012042 [Rhamnusium bicolor]|uniref:DDE Tnp4 domain-containing protein n=1 Tax=Rhamnusium bicolor TaxID=1586634 RepID=A0AAV8XEW0_9CUCU|nr:hypothetical protein NQ314_012042 [Rhamnusium bicolor]
MRHLMVGRSAAGEIVRRVCRAVWKIMREECIPKPDKKMWKEVANEFERRANFPHCLGAVDGKHIRVVKPEKSGSLYYNYKNYFSISLMAVADSNYRFVMLTLDRLEMMLSLLFSRIVRCGKA